MAQQPSRRSALEVGTDIISAMNAEFHDAPDRVIAIVGAAYLESLVEEILRAIFVEDDKAVSDLLRARLDRTAHAANSPTAWG